MNWLGRPSARSTRKGDVSFFANAGAWFSTRRAPHGAGALFFSDPLAAASQERFYRGRLEQITQERGNRARKGATREN